MKVEHGGVFCTDSVSLVYEGEVLQASLRLLIEALMSVVVSIRRRERCPPLLFHSNQFVSLISDITVSLLNGPLVLALLN